MIYTKYRDRHDRLVINFEAVPLFLFWWYKKRIVDRFKLRLSGNKVSKTNTTKSQTLESTRGSVKIEWDGCSGLSVIALDRSSDELVMEILNHMKHLSSKLHIFTDLSKKMAY